MPIIVLPRRGFEHLIGTKDYLGRIFVSTFGFQPSSNVQQKRTLHTSAALENAIEV
jgi:hypothetical protein